jgi:hypothetical protein
MVMRTGWEIDDRYLMFDAAPWGGPHAHQDRLQIVAYAGGRDLLVDPGNYSYDQPLSSDYFRKSEAHNILTVDGKEQPSADPLLLAWHSSPEADFGSARIEQGAVRHQRSVLFVKPDYWVVVDHVFGTDLDRHEVTRLFHFPIANVETEGKIIRTTFHEGTNLQIQAVDDSRIRIAKGWLPVGPAEAKEAPVAAIVWRDQLPATLCAVLTPFGDAKMLPTITQIQDDPGILHIRVAAPSGQTDDIAFAFDPVNLRIVDTAGKGRVVLVRKGPRSNAALVIDGSLPH